MSTIDKEKRIIVRIDDELKKQYQIYCLNNDINMSERIRELIQKDLEGKIK
jgi:hypothetical protein